MILSLIALEQHGFVWSKNIEAPTSAINDGKISLGAKETDGTFTSEMTMLEKNETYFVRSFAISENDEIYGETISFRTNDIQLTTDSITYIRARTATIHGSFYGINSSVELNRLGVVWSLTNPTPVIDGESPDSFEQLGAGELEDGSFSASMTGLKDSSTYFYRTFAILNFGNEIIYGDTKTWDTNLNDVWHQKESLFEETHSYSGFSANGFGFYLSGKKIFRYDPMNDIWEAREENTNGIRQVKASYFMIGSNFYVTCGGLDSVDPVTKKMYKYDTVNDEWTEMPDFPGEARRSVIGFSIGDVGYMGCGQRSDGTRIVDFWKFEEGVGWTELEVNNPDFPGTTHYVAIGSFSDGERGFITGDQASANFWVYDPVTNSWDERGDLPGGVSHGMVGFQINNQLHLATGTSEGQTATKVLWRYNHEDDSWLEMASLPGLARFGAIGFAIGDKGYIGGGLSPNASGSKKEFWEYKMLEGG